MLALKDWDNQKFAARTFDPEMERRRYPAQWRAKPATESGPAIFWERTSILDVEPATSSERLASSSSTYLSARSSYFGLNLFTILPSHFVSAYREMEDYRSLDDGWDGFDSFAPLPGVIDDAQAFLSALPKEISAPEPTIGADGTVGWFWKTDHVYASVAFLGTGRFAYWAETAKFAAPVKGAGYFNRTSVPEDLLDIIRLA